ncbi:hypothetical protein [Glutamicibacter arilaitensis]|uniref:hypothetical protein n=1 Tax=Glutamicibacter arilaitensis TaxID=256701 RepID=UPI003F8F826F
MSNQTPLNPDALRVATAAAHDAVDWQMYDVTKFDLEDSVDVATIAAVSAYLAVAQLVVNSVEELITTRAGLALANAAFNEGLSAGIRACNESLEGEPFVKPVSPYRSEVDE